MSEIFYDELAKIIVKLFQSHFTDYLLCKF